MPFEKVRVTTTEEDGHAHAIITPISNMPQETPPREITRAPVGLVHRVSRVGKVRNFSPHKMQPICCTHASVPIYTITLS